MLDRGQVYYIEFIVVLFFFLAALAFFMHNMLITMDDSGISISTQEARIVSEHLISAGMPEDWNTSNVQRLGLTDGFSRINNSKLLGFKNMDYIMTKNLFNIASDYYFYLEDKNQTRILIDGEQGIGLEPADAKRVIKNVRLAVYNSEIVKMVILIWQKT